MEEFLEHLEEVAGEPLDQHTEPKKSRGRRLEIDDSELFGSLSRLFDLASSTWPEIVLGLRHVKTKADLPSALQAWMPDRDSHPIVDALLREGDRPADPKKLRGLEHRRSDLTDSFTRTDERLKQCRAAFDKANVVPLEPLSEDQKSVVEAQRKKRASALARAGIEHMAVEDQLKELIQEIKDSQSYLARDQLVQFCRSKYAKNPVNLASALAGWPYIEYRRSIDRCKKLKADDEVPLLKDNGVPFHTIALVRRISDGCDNRSKLVEYAKQWLRGRQVSKSDKNFVALAELGENFYYLGCAIETVVPTKPRTSELAERITAEYYRRRKSSGPADKLFAEDERIVIKCK